mgnify:FL=1
MTDIDLLILLARATVGASEVPPNTNSGPFVERCQKVTGNKKGDPWCASFIAMLGQLAFGAAWPLPLTGGCQALHDAALAKNLIQVSPVRGDLFLVWHAELSRFAHVGLVTGEPIGNTAPTISGNTSGGGSREGWLVGERVWTFTGKDRFIRWAHLIS